MKIRYIDKPAGANKTRFIIAEIAEMVRWGHKVLLVQKSKDLIDQTYRHLTEGASLAPFVTRLHEDTVVGQHVVSAIINHFRNAEPKGQALIITEQAFDLVPYFHRAEFWDLIFDECPHVEKGFSIEVPVNHGFLTEHVMTRGEGLYVPLCVKSEADLRNIVRKKDKVNDIFRDAAKQLLSAGWDCFVHQERYDSIVDGDKGAKKLCICSVRNTLVISRFKTCTVASAMFKDTFFFKILSNRGVDFVDYGERAYAPVRKDAEITFSFDRHPNGHLLDIHYLDVPRWSKEIMKKHASLVSDLKAYAIGVFSDRPFIFQSNKAKDDFQIDNLALVKADGVDIGGASHGLNSYEYIDNAFIYTARNPDDDYRRFLNWLGLSDRDIDIGIHCLEIYQAAMRCSLRDIESTTRKIVIVPDTRAAFWLAGLFDGVTLTKVPIEVPKRVGKVGRPRIHASDKDRKRAQRARDKEKRQDNLPVEENGIIVTCHETLIREDIVTRTIQNNDMIWILNFYDPLHIKGGPGYTPAATHVVPLVSVVEVVNMMSAAFDMSYQKKVDNPCFNFTIFDDPHVNAREAIYAQGTSAIILDNDGGGISRAEFARIFHSEKMIISNSFSSTREWEKWRAVILLSRAVSGEEYRRLLQAIMIELEAHGYAVHGFDKSKKSLVDIFHFPCRADNGESFFEELVGDERQLINPDYWLQKVPAHVPSPPIAPLHIEGEEWPPEVTEAVKEAVAIFDETGTRAGQGDGAIWDLATDLWTHGLQADEARPILDDAARRSTSPEDRLKQVERIIKGWSK
ncbi:hypothetical protein EZH22_05325 [Xanthobacter dioxanivorans]|uniref:Uncharacterized protein n=1 Tax=Xanthobacter dioxanivorans TaxID=2528964 RepID=A0A974PQG6_9HYPH|nr:hypothetical protein [Xanthobacter dioxanivorans]QRG07800.1 hypothetical protein EZH22_05325 [Xanthobacter dioxanivorans]